MHRRLGGLWELGRSGDHEARGLEHHVAADHVRDQVGRRRLGFDRADASDEVLVEQAFGHPAEGDSAGKERLSAHVPHVKERLGVVDRLP